MARARRKVTIGRKLGQDLVELRARRERDKLTKESHVLRGVLDLLAAEGIVHYRLNSGEVMVEGRRVRLCPEGTPDVLVLWPVGRRPFHRPIGPPSHSMACVNGYSVPVFMEIKRPMRGRLRTSQESEHLRLRRAGAPVLVIDDVTQLQEMLKTQGDAP